MKQAKLPLQFDTLYLDLVQVFCGEEFLHEEKFCHLSQRISWTEILLESQLKATNRSCPVVHLSKSVPRSNFCLEVEKLLSDYLDVVL